MCGYKKKNTLPTTVLITNLAKKIASLQLLIVDED